MPNKTDSFVVGNSRQVLDLSREEQECLNTADWVFACNGFLSHSVLAGFCPTVWAMGDTSTPFSLDLLQRQLNAVRRDRVMRARLRHLFVCCESDEALHIVYRSGLPVTLYQRGRWSDSNQSFAKSLYEPLYHRSTGCDLLNLAMILNPQGTSIKVVGCQRGINTGHFYDEPREDSAPGQLIELPMWGAFEQANWHGWNVIDCNLAHDPQLPQSYIPRGKLL